MSNSNQLNEILKYLAQFHPMAGTIEMYAGQEAPAGWLICDGSAISRTTYSKLFEVIGQTYGAGDGNTTFNLPDMSDNPYVIEEGVSGIWTYKKWSDGTAECWGTSDLGTPSWLTYFTANTIIYYQNFNVSLPFHFTEGVAVSNAHTIGSNIGWVGNCRINTSTDVVTFNISRNGNTGACSAEHHIKGKWTDSIQPSITYIISTGQVEYSENEQEENNG